MMLSVRMKLMKLATEYKNIAEGEKRGCQSTRGHQLILKHIDYHQLHYTRVDDLGLPGKGISLTTCLKSESSTSYFHLRPTQS